VNYLLLTVPLMFGIFFGHLSFGYEQNQVRYLNSLEFFNSLRQVFPPKDDLGRSDHDYHCLHFSSSNRGLVGAIDPVSGELVSKKPSASLIKWLSGCVFDVTRSAMWVDDNVSLMIGEAALKEFKSKNFLEGKAIFMAPISILSEQGKQSFIDHATLRTLGSDSAILSYKLVKEVRALKQIIHTAALKDSKTFGDYMKKVYLGLVLRDEFLSY
jgi:hypothetical protein